MTRRPDAWPGWSIDCWPARKYGERRARHWLDVVRFAETNGYERDGAKPNAWRYRDYVIDALNHDKPYDRFLTEQLAGDEIEGVGRGCSDRDHIPATGHLGRRAGRAEGRPLRPARRRSRHGRDRVPGNHAAVRRCHDHKFEPFSQVDYYRMLAVFEPLKASAERPRPSSTARSEPKPSWLLISGPWPRPTPISPRPGTHRGARQSQRSTQLLAPAEERERRKTARQAHLAAAARGPSVSDRAIEANAGSARSRQAAFAEKLEAEVREIAPQEVKAALRPLEERLAAIKASSQRASSRLHLV